VSLEARFTRRMFLFFVLRNDRFVQRWTATWPRLLGGPAIHIYDLTEAVDPEDSLVPKGHRAKQFEST
jgi:hypothetical protein